MTDMTVAETIIQQMGGQRRLAVMVGAHNFTGTEDYVQFSFRGSRRVNTCRVTLDRAWDLYTFELFQWRPKRLEMAPVYKAEQVYDDMLVKLFESETGLYLSL